MAAEQATGMVLLDKPAGLSSFQAIARLRPLLGRKLGHTGTLDPFATGLLIVLAGRATRLAPYLGGLEKRYRAIVQLGATSTTDDPEGTIEQFAGSVTRDALEAVLPQFLGVIEQVPPAASAIHVDGDRAYRRFRRGEAVTIPARTVAVHELTLLAFDPTAQTAEIDVRCSTGTYVRALARDLGIAVSSAGYCAGLRRTAIGALTVDEAGTVAAPGPIRSLKDALRHLPMRELDRDEVVTIGHGRAIAAGGEQEGPVALIFDNRLIAVAQRDGVLLRPNLVLEPAA